VSNVSWLIAMVAGTAAIVWGAERFAEHLADASKRLGVTAFALAILLPRSPLRPDYITGRDTTDVAVTTVASPSGSAPASVG